MTKTVGIVTLWYFGGNFGSVIQNWALHQYLKKKFDLNSITLVNKGNSELTPSCKAFFEFPDKVWQEFKNFKDGIPHIVLSPSEISKDTASVFIIGGDQVLNCKQNPAFDPKYHCLSNIQKNKKLLYSASICYDHFATYKKSDPSVRTCYNELKNMHALSFRERLKDFPKETQYIDPALLLNREDYEAIEEKPEGDIPKKFDFLYLVKHQEGFSDTLTFFLKNKKNKYPLITNRDNLNLGPKQIIWCIHHCKNLYTNSFHCMLFSIIFRKKIIFYHYYYKNNPFNDFRVKNLTEFLNIKYKNNKITNYREVQKNIKIQQQRSFEYLNKNIKECLELQKCEKYPKIYAAFRKDKSLRDLSASGGMSALLAETVFDKNGVVWGASYAQDFRSVHHICVKNMNQYYRLIASSKYNISFLNGVFPKIEAQLKNGTFVMFTGTPCQILALKKYLKKDYENLLTVDLLCHGVSKENILDNYINTIENNHKSNVVNLNMRTNHDVVLTAIMANGDIFTDKNAIHEIFINKENLHNMCKNCNRHYGNNLSDITLGDFWDVEKTILNDPVFKNENVVRSGINRVKINTMKGEKFFNFVSDDTEYRKVDL